MAFSALPLAATAASIPTNSLPTPLDQYHDPVGAGLWDVPRGGTSSNWSEGAICAVAWDKVTDYLVFKSIKHYQKGREIFKKHSRKA